MRMPAVRRTVTMEWLWRLHGWLYRATGGRIGGRMMGFPVLLLTTKGRKSGELRTTALMYMPDGSASVVIASNAGEPRDPAWWLNLRADPRATIQRGSALEPVRAREAAGEQRARLWSNWTAKDPSYLTYQERTRRQIPVVVLEPAVEAAPPGTGR